MKIKDIEVNGKVYAIYGYTPIIEHTDTTATIEPNVMHKWGEVAELNIELEPPTDNTMVNEYLVQFKSGATPTVLNFPSDIKWGSSSTPKVNKEYIISIINNVAVMGGA